MHLVNRPRIIPAFALAAFALAAFLFPAPAALAADREPATTIDEISYPPLPSQDVPQPRRVELDNGMVVMLLEDHELPLVDAIAYVRTGDRLEPADKVGLAQMTGQVLRSGGTEKRSADELDEFLDSRAASVETSIGTNSGFASMSSLKADFPEVLAVFADVLRNPVFDADKLEVARTQLSSAISRQNDNPQGIAFREFYEVVYGGESPYARDETYATVGAVTREDLVAWHETYFHPNRVVLGLVGDFDGDEALALVRKEFGDWARGPAPEPGEGDVFYLEENPAGVFYVAKNDITQANILMGHLGIVRDNPDYYAVEGMNNVLSGSFASRLFSNVRSAKGLAYAVSGSVGSSYDHPGVTQIFTTTKTETTGAAIEALLEEARGMSANPPSDDEVTKAKTSILNSFVFESDSTREILTQQLTYEYYGYPLDWLERYRKGIDAVTTAEVHAVAEKYIHPDRFSILVVAPQEGLDKPLSAYGEVTAVDISIPEPAAERAEVTAEGRAAAVALIERAVEAMGGAAAVDGVAALLTRGVAVQTTPQGEFEIPVESLRVFPDRTRQQMTLPFGEMTMVVDGDGGFVISPQGVADLPGSQLAAMKKSSARDPLALLRSRNDDGFSATALGAEGGLERVQVEIGGEVTVVGIDGDGHLVEVAYQDSGPTGAPGETKRTYGDFRQAGGLVYPFSLEASFDGDTTLVATLESVEVDPDFDEAVFERPE